MPFDADDIAAFNDTDMPAFALATIGAVQIPGRFRSAYADALGMSGSRPAFSASSADLAGAVEGTSITVNSTAYTVAITEPGDTGQTRLILEAV